MSKYPIYLIFLCSVAITEIKSADDFYCSVGLCASGNPHIACGNNGEFSNNCPKNAKMVSLEPYKETILDMHNSKRNLIASGALSGYMAAERMATMQWDEELAAMAALNVKQCVMKHDKCRNTQKFSKSGQNLALLAYTGAEKNKSDAELIENRVMAWWNEYKNCNMKMIENYPKNYSGPAIGHFTVFVADKNIRLGCAAIRFTRNKKHNFLIGCNYATTNIINRPIYKAGIAGKGCTTGRNSKYTSLCSEWETYTGL